MRQVVQSFFFEFGRFSTNDPRKRPLCPLKNSSTTLWRRKQSAKSSKLNLKMIIIKSDQHAVWHFFDQILFPTHFFFSNFPSQFKVHKFKKMSPKYDTQLKSQTERSMVNSETRLGFEETKLVRLFFSNRIDLQQKIIKHDVWSSLGTQVGFDVARYHHGPRWSIRSARSPILYKLSTEIQLSWSWQ